MKSVDVEKLRDILLVAEGKMKMPEEQIDIDALLKIRTAKLKGNFAVDALLADREEGW